MAGRRGVGHARTRPGSARLSLRAARIVAAKDLRDLAREKTLLVAVLVQAFIAAFSSITLVGLQGLYDPGAVDATSGTVAYVGPGGFDAFLRSADGVRVTVMSEDAAFAAFDRGAVDAVVNESWDGPDGVRTIVLTMDEDRVTTPVMVSRVKLLLQDYESQLRLEREDRLQQQVLDLDRGAQPPYGFAFATLLPLLAIVPVFLSGAVAGDTFAQEIQDRTLLVLRSAPVPAGAIVAGKVSLAVLLAPAQTILWMGLLAANGYAAAHPILILLAVTGLAAILCAVAVGVALMVRQEGPAQAAYALGALALAVASQALPRDPLNLLARFAVGPPDAVGVASLVAIGVAGLAGVAGASWFAARRMRADRV